MWLPSMQFVLPSVQSVDYQLPQDCPLRPEAERCAPHKKLLQRCLELSVLPHLLHYAQTCKQQS